ncbi:hypothetical protein AVEN_8029-1 [Araneus ventricosus]|uniref:Uncharacterized protein n=1 Tax=Araneus ventricosus TaxID=182803 RepID=A0A4Y2W4M3_ARAVE|nr:hypothetical protein AVEN_8029-1 [Araneus ventricosus]
MLSNHGSARWRRQLRANTRRRERAASNGTVQREATAQRHTAAHKRLEEETGEHNVTLLNNAQQRPTTGHEPPQNAASSR